MGSRTVSFDFDLGDLVAISNTSRSGVITMCAIDDGGEFYLVELEDKDGHINGRWYRPGRLVRTRAK